MNKEHLVKYCLRRTILQSVYLDFAYRPVGGEVTCWSLEREVWGSNLGPVKSDTGLSTARLRCDVTSKEAVLARRNDAEMVS